MVGLSSLNTNLFDRVSKYKDSINYKIAETELQSQLRETSAQVNEADGMIETNERIVKRLIQQQKKLSNEEISKIIIAYEAGLTVYQLAEQFDCHRTTVSQHLKSRGIKMRNRPLSEAQIDEAVRLYESGLSCARVGKIVGADAETIRARLQERGVRIRGPHERLGR